MNDRQFRLAQRLVRLRRWSERKDALAVLALRSQQALAARQLQQLSAGRRRADRPLRQRLTGRTGGLGPPLAELLAEYRHQHQQALRRCEALRRELEELAPRLERVSASLAESMARRKASELLLGRLAARRAAEALSRQAREQDELRQKVQDG